MSRLMRHPAEKYPSFGSFASIQRRVFDAPARDGSPDYWYDAARTTGVVG